MTALFADTFYWIALADSTVAALQRATSQSVTTDEVLSEYLTFFSTTPEPFRRRAAEGAAGEFRGAGDSTEPGIFSRWPRPLPRPPR